MSEKKVAGAGGGRKTRQSQGQPDFFKLQSLVEVQAVRMAEGAADRAKVWFQHRAGLSAPIQRALWDVTKKQATEWIKHEGIVKGLTGFLYDEIKQVVGPYVERKVLTCCVTADPAGKPKDKDLAMILDVLRQVGCESDLRKLVLVPWMKLEPHSRTADPTRIVTEFLADDGVSPRTELFWCACTNFLLTDDQKLLPVIAETVKRSGEQALSEPAKKISSFCMLDLREPSDKKGAGPRALMSRALRDAAAAGLSLTQRAGVAPLDSRRSNRDRKRLSDRTGDDIRLIEEAKKSKGPLPYSTPAAINQEDALGRRVEGLGRLGVLGKLDIDPELLADNECLKWFFRLCAKSNLPLDSCDILRTAILEQKRDKSADNARFAESFRIMLADLSIVLPQAQPAEGGLRCIMSRKSNEATTDDTYLRGQLGELGAEATDVMVFELGFSRLSGL